MTETEMTTSFHDPSVADGYGEYSQDVWLCEQCNTVTTPEGDILE